MPINYTMAFTQEGELIQISSGQTWENKLDGRKIYIVECVAEAKYSILDHDKKYTDFHALKTLVTSSGINCNFTLIDDPSTVNECYECGILDYDLRETIREIEASILNIKQILDEMKGNITQYQSQSHHQIPCSRDLELPGSR